MLSFIGRRVFCASKNVLKKSKRTFLSNAYSCQEVWERRKNSPVFKKIDYDDLYHQLDRSFQIGLRISALDVDLFANGVDSDAFQDELEDMLFKLRLNPESSLLRDRTIHAVIRFYLSIGKKQELLTILSNRVNYGIFPDYYTANMLMDVFLKEKDVVSAAKVAVLQMLQEDFDHPITRPLSLYSCLKYLNSEEIWLPPKEPEVDPDEDEVKVRVMFIRQPYFDDHFDIVDTNHLIGKTMSMAGSGQTGPLGASCQVLGLVLHEKWPEVLTLAQRFSKEKTEIYKEAVEKAIEFMKTRPKTPEGAKEAEETEATKKTKSDVLNALVLLKDTAIAEDLEGAAAAVVSGAVGANEANDIASLSKLYEQWEKEREEHIKEEIFESEKRKAMEIIEATREELSKEEEMVFFFDKEDEWELKVQEKQKEIQKLEGQNLKSKGKETDVDYIPPDVSQRRQ